MSEQEPEQELPSEAQEAIQRMKRWVSEPGTKLLREDALPKLPGGGKQPTPPASGGIAGLAPAEPAEPAVAIPLTTTLPPARQAKLQEVALLLAERITNEMQSLRGSKPFPARSPERRQVVRHRAQSLLGEMSDLPWHVQGPEEANFLLELVEREVLGAGPLEPLLADRQISEVMVIGPAQVFIERAGKVSETSVRFQNEGHLTRIIRNILQPLDRMVSRSLPIVDGRLPDGSRVNVIIPPSAINGPALTIRKFPRQPMLMEDLIALGTLTPEMASLLYACVLARLNIVISGGSVSGKTTLLNALSECIPARERIVTIEDAAELQLTQGHVVRLETKPPEQDGSGRVTLRDLVVNAARMRPDRVIVGECRGGEALELLQAMNMEYAGSLMTTHATSPRDCLTRLETMVLLSGMELPLVAVRRQIASAVQVIVQQARLRDGSRKVTSISEVQGFDDQAITLQDVFHFKETGTDSRMGKVQGIFEPGGVKPKFYQKLVQAGVRLPEQLFEPSERRRQPLDWDALPWS